MTERSVDERIDNPFTTDDFILAAGAWATGQRSNWNAIQTAFVNGGMEGQDPHTSTELADSAKAQALAAVAQVMLARDALEWSVKVGQNMVDSVDRIR